jgi:hypothetical protein
MEAIRRRRFSTLEFYRITITWMIRCHSLGYFLGKIHMQMICM